MQSVAPAPKQIGHVFIANTIGGCESCCRMVMQHAPEHHHHVLFFSPEGEATGMLQGFAKTVSHHPISSKHFRKYRDTVQTWAKTHQLEGAILWHGMVALPPLIQGLKRAGCAVMVHGGNPAVTTSVKQDFKFLFLEALFPWKPLPTYFTCSAYVARSYQRSRYLCRFPKAVIHNGVALTDVRAGIKSDPTETVRIGMTARLDPGKDHALVLHAFALALQQLPKMRLEFLGDGELRQPLEALAISLKIDHAVTFLGTRRDVTAVMQFWDIFAYATTDFEGFGNSLVEAMSLGLPCVVNDVGPISEVVGDPKNAWITPQSDASAFAQALVKLAQDPTQRAQMGQIAQAYARTHYAPGQYAQRVIHQLFASS